MLVEGIVKGVKGREHLVKDLIYLGLSLFVGEGLWVGIRLWMLLEGKDTIV